MIRGEKVLLRARTQADVAILHAELYEDVATRARADTRPWVPLAADSPSAPYRVHDATDAALFSVEEIESGDLAGEALLWGIDNHNRSAHVGISLRPAFRGRGLAVETLALLVRYGFGIRGLHRLQMETLASNKAMVAAALRAGFEREGQLRDAAWVDGGFEDELILGLLSTASRI